MTLSLSPSLSRAHFAASFVVLALGAAAGGCVTQTQHLAVTALPRVLSLPRGARDVVATDSGGQAGVEGGADVRLVLNGGERLRLPAHTRAAIATGLPATDPRSLALFEVGTAPESGRLLRVSDVAFVELTQPDRTWNMVLMGLGFFGAAVGALLLVAVIAVAAGGLDGLAGVGAI